MGMGRYRVCELVDCGPLRTVDASEDVSVTVLGVPFVLFAGDLDLSILVTVAVSIIISSSSSGLEY